MGTEMPIWETDEPDETAGERLRVVIADDASAMRALLGRILEGSSSFDVVGEARDGEEAVRLAGTLHPDVVVLDVAMPLMDGLAAIPLIRQASPTSRIVVLSAMDAGRVRAQALASGADAFIEKRVRPGSLAQGIVEACLLPRGGIDDGQDPSATAPGRPGRDWFRLTFEHAPIGMVLLDIDGRFQDVNESFCQMVARPSSRLVGSAVDEICHPDDFAHHAGLRRRLLGPASDPAGAKGELRFVREDGAIAWTIATWCLLPAGDGSPWRFLGQVVDVTERKLAEVTRARVEELRERHERELARSNADLALFATVAAHDLKSPLQVISGFGSLLEETQGDVLDERGKEFLAYILKSATRMNLLIDDLLAYAKVGADRHPPEAVPLERVLDEVRAGLDAEILASGASVDSEPLPVVTGDPAQFVHLLENLVANGLKFVADGTTPRITLSASRMAAAWCIDVADNCIGVAPQYRSHIFGMFQRLGQDDYEGTGIGLAICKRIVEQRGGSIWVEENPKGGSRFRFTVPDEPGSPWLDDGPAHVLDSAKDNPECGPTGAPPVELARHGPGSDPGAGRSTETLLEVLLVEDDDDHARLVEETLTRGSVEGCRLRRAHDLAGARAELHLHRTDCILLDLFLPDGQGLDSLRQLTTLEPLVPIVILTSLADEKLGLQAVHAGAQDYLVKGTVDGPRLVRSLRHAIERKALEARFAEQALHDPLTGLANRTLLFDRLRLEITRIERSGTGVAVFYLDVDGFKAINDRRGHDTGDEVLVRTARRLSRVVRPGDTVGRIGGDEFVVICGGLDNGSDVDQMQARIEKAIRRPLLLGNENERVTASIGVAIGNVSTEEPEAIISRADDAMYLAKRRRRAAGLDREPRADHLSLGVPTG
jgi:diguanylate cyclase (GGDEF)-like protein/PAS domain S-box-containing protein